MGSAAAYHLARQGRRVLGLEQFTPAHDKGSSHGRTRVIRQAYFEDPAYVPLLLRAYQLWRRLECESGRKILRITGGLMLGAPEGGLVRGSLRSAVAHNLPHEMLDAREIRRRYPVFHPPQDMVALFEKHAGILRPEVGIRAHLELAERRGADLRFGERVLQWSADASGVRVETTSGIHQAERLVLAPGAWAPEVLRDIALPLEVERQVLYWFAPGGGVGAFESLPVYIWDAPEAMPYGFPATDGCDGGVKISFYRAPGTRSCHPETVDRVVAEEEISMMRDFIARLIPAFSEARCLQAVTCLYTNTPDLNFVVATHPLHQNVALACGFSGHGYKFCPVVGEILADLSTHGKTPHPIELFSPKRPALSVPG